MKNSAVKWLVIICVVSWAAHNPAQVSADIHQLLAAGQALVSSVAGAAGGAFSGATSGGH
ncbi:MAG TPA: hypothetical protein VET24_02030 [Actinomycetota bacterium]|nr:hypothetical protein [Actinomycetota bacterium]